MFIPRIVYTHNVALTHILKHIQIVFYMRSIIAKKNVLRLFFIYLKVEYISVWTLFPTVVPYDTTDDSFGLHWFQFNIISTNFDPLPPQPILHICNHFVVVLIWLEMLLLWLGIVSWKTVFQKYCPIFSSKTHYSNHFLSGLGTKLFVLWHIEACLVSMFKAKFQRKRVLTVRNI